MSGISKITDYIPNKVSDLIVKRCPNMTIESEKVKKFVGWCGENLSSPENRLLLGVSAIMSQPFIDLSNKKVDEDTRKVSAARTCAKIIAGTTTGVAIRALSIKLVKMLSKFEKDVTNPKYKNLQTLLTPPRALKGIVKDLTQYQNACGTILATVVMLFTNFLIDAPLTKFLTNKFVDKIHNQQNTQVPSQKLKEGING